MLKHGKSHVFDNFTLTLDILCKLEITLDFLCKLEITLDFLCKSEIPYECQHECPVAFPQKGSPYRCGSCEVRAPPTLRALAQGGGGPWDEESRLAIIPIISWQQGWLDWLEAYCKKDWERSEPISR